MTTEDSGEYISGLIDDLEASLQAEKERNMTTPAEWSNAKQHFDNTRAMYQELEGTPGVNTTIALRATFDPLAIRYNCGERSPELYDEMLAVE